jgi:hypothetical protein
MKMGTTASPWRYEVAVADAIRPDDQRRTAILRYALMGGCLPDFAGGPVTLRLRPFRSIPGTARWAKSGRSDDLTERRVHGDCYHTTEGIASVKIRQQKASRRAPLAQLSERSSIGFKIKQLLDRLTLADDRERSRIKHDLRRKRSRVVV